VRRELHGIGEEVASIIRTKVYSVPHARRPEASASAIAAPCSPPHNG
jgi:hypothetical protein